MSHRHDDDDEQAFTNDEGVPTEVRAAEDYSPPEQQEQQQELGGEAKLKPQPGGGFKVERNYAAEADKFIRSNLHLIAIALVIIFFFGRRFTTWLLDVQSRAAVRGAQQSDDAKIEDGLRAARERQQLASREASRRDAELKEKRRVEELKEKERRMQEAREQAEAAGEHVNNNNTNTMQLPRLPGGDRYQPSSSWGDSGGGGGGGYRPTGFRRPQRGG